jgi:3-phenylpropionate/trans-cinnamate dioxygenase ferredoxin subunit
VTRYVVSRADDLSDGDRKVVEVNGRSIGIFNVHGEYFALRNVCPHQGGPLCAGVVWSYVHSRAPGDYDYDAERKLVRCPWHGWEFELSTGKSWFDPRRMRVKSYDVGVVAGAYLADTEDIVEGPYEAETYPVLVDGEYLVIDID